MRRLLAAGLLVALAALGGCSSDAGRYSPVPDVGPARIDVDTPALRTVKRQAGIAPCEPGSGSNDLPAVTLPCFGGGPAVALDELEGPLVLNLWQVTCGPCRVELPLYQRLSTQLAGRATVLGVDFNDTPTDDAMALLKASGVTYPQLADPQELLRTARPRIPLLGVPVLVLVDSRGKVTFAAPTAIRSYEQLTDLVSTHLGIAA